MKPKCAKCGNEHKSNDCQATQVAKCFVCGTNHDPLDRLKCPKIVQADARQHRKTKQKIAQSYADAVRITNRSNNPFDLLSSEGDDEHATEIVSELVNPPSGSRKRRRTAVPTRRTEGSGEGARARSYSGEPHRAKVDGPSTSSAGRDRDYTNTGPRRPVPRTPNSTNNSSPNQPGQSILHILRPLLTNLVTCLPVATEWKQLICTSINYFFDTLYPLLYPLLSPIIMSLLSQSRSNHGC